MLRFSLGLLRHEQKQSLPRIYHFLDHFSDLQSNSPSTLQQNTRKWRTFLLTASAATSSSTSTCNSSVLSSVAQSKHAQLVAISVNTEQWNRLFDDASSSTSAAAAKTASTIDELPANEAVSLITFLSFHGHTPWALSAWRRCIVTTSSSSTSSSSSSSSSSSNQTKRDSSKHNSFLPLLYPILALSHIRDAVAVTNATNSKGKSTSSSSSSCDTISDLVKFLLVPPQNCRKSLELAKTLMGLYREEVKLMMMTLAEQNQIVNDRDLHYDLHSQQFAARVGLLIECVMSGSNKETSTMDTEAVNFWLSILLNSNNSYNNTPSSALPSVTQQVSSSTTSSEEVKSIDDTLEYLFESHDKKDTAIEKLWYSARRHDHGKQALNDDLFAYLLAKHPKLFVSSLNCGTSSNSQQQSFLTCEKMIDVIDRVIEENDRQGEKNTSSSSLSSSSLLLETFVRSVISQPDSSSWSSFRLVLKSILLILSNVDKLTHDDVLSPPISIKQWRVLAGHLQEKNLTRSDDAQAQHVDSLMFTRSLDKMNRIISSNNLRTMSGKAKASGGTIFVINNIANAFGECLPSLFQILKNCRFPLPLLTSSFEKLCQWTLEASLLPAAACAGEREGGHRNLSLMKPTSLKSDGALLFRCENLFSTLLELRTLSPPPQHSEGFVNKRTTTIVTSSLPPLVSLHLLLRFPQQISMWTLPLLEDVEALDKMADEFASCVFSAEMLTLDFVTKAATTTTAERVLLIHQWLDRLKMVFRIVESKVGGVGGGASLYLLLNVAVAFARATEKQVVATSCCASSSSSSSSSSSPFAQLIEAQDQQVRFALSAVVSFVYQVSCRLLLQRALRVPSESTSHNHSVAFDATFFSTLKSLFDNFLVKYAPPSQLLNHWIHLLRLSTCPVCVLQVAVNEAIFSSSPDISSQIALFAAFRTLGPGVSTIRLLLQQQQHQQQHQQQSRTDERLECIERFLKIFSFEGKVDHSDLGTSEELQRDTLRRRIGAEVMLEGFACVLISNFYPILLFGQADSSARTKLSRLYNTFVEILVKEFQLFEFTEVGVNAAAGRGGGGGGGSEGSGGEHNQSQQHHHHQVLVPTTTSTIGRLNGLSDTTLDVAVTISSLEILWRAFLGTTTVTEHNDNQSKKNGVALTLTCLLPRIADRLDALLRRIASSSAYQYHRSQEKSPVVSEASAVVVALKKNAPPPAASGLVSSSTNKNNNSNNNNDKSFLIKTLHQSIVASSDQSLVSFATSPLFHLHQDEARNLLKQIECSASSFVGKQEKDQARRRDARFRALMDSTFSSSSSWSQNWMKALQICSEELVSSSSSSSLSKSVKDAHGRKIFSGSCCATHRQLCLHHQDHFLQHPHFWLAMRRGIAVCFEENDQSEKVVNNNNHNNKRVSGSRPSPSSSSSSSWIGACQILDNIQFLSSTTIPGDQLYWRCVSLLRRSGRWEETMKLMSYPQITMMRTTATTTATPSTTTVTDEASNAVSLMASLCSSLLKGKRTNHVVSNHYSANSNNNKNNNSDSAHNATKEELLQLVAWIRSKGFRSDFSSFSESDGKNDDAIDRGAISEQYSSFHRSSLASLSRLLLRNELAKEAAHLLIPATKLCRESEAKSLMITGGGEEKSSVKQSFHHNDSSSKISSRDREFYKNANIVFREVVKKGLWPRDHWEQGIRFAQHNGRDDLAAVIKARFGVGF